MDSPVGWKSRGRLGAGEVPSRAGTVGLRRTFRREVLLRISTQAHSIPNASLKNRLLLLLVEVRQLLENTHEHRFSAPSGRHVCPGMGPGRWLRRRKDRDRTGCAARAHRLGHEGAAARLALTQDLPGRVAAGRVAKIRPQVSSIVQRRRFEQGRQARASPGVVPDPSGCVHGGSRYGGRTSSRLSSCSSRRTRTWSRQGRPSFHGSR